MFRGVSNLNLDSKGRMAMPTRYREAILEGCEGHMVMTVDFEACLLLYPQHEWMEIESKLVKLPSFNKQTRNLQRLLLGHATEVDMDANGRILIPPPLRVFAKMDKHIVLIGQGNKFELWNEETWNGGIDKMLDEGLDMDDLPDEVGSLSL